MSNSRLVHDRFQLRSRRRKIVAVLYVIAMAAYLVWRTTIINEDAPGLSLTYFTAEILGFVLGLTLIFSSWRYRHRESPPAPTGLSVDVFVTTYREPVELVRWTVIAAREIAYPHQTFLLDDGNRPEMRALATELGVRYFARGQNTHAKAGNLNFGLDHSTAEFVMVFDADHIALPHALDATLGFFGDPRVALVQAPQDYYNIDAFQYFNARNGGLWHDQSFFYQIAQACRDWYNGASCVGTSVVYRRSALDGIGGIPTDTVTEDIHTSLKLHKAGHEVVYFNEPIAYGIAAADLRDYYKTRHRWAHGNIHALRVEKILTCSGLTFAQRLSYLTLAIVYLEGWQQLLLVIVPWMSLFFGWAPFDITVFNVLVVLLFPVLTMLLLQELGCGLSRYWVNEVFSMARFPIHLVAALALVSGKMRFHTSAKNVRGRVEWRLMAPQLIVLAVSLGAVTAGAVHLALDFQVGPLALALVNLSFGNFGAIDWNARLDQGYALELVAVAGFWALFNATKGWYVIRKAVHDARRSADDYRFDIRLPIEFTTPAGTVMARVDRISRSWFSAQLYGDAAVEIGEWLPARLHLPAGVTPIDCVVTERMPLTVKHVSIGKLAVEIVVSRSDEARISGEIIFPNQQARDRLMRSLYSVDWHREYMHRNAFFTTPLEFLGRLLSFKRPFGPAIPEWAPALLRSSDHATSSYAVIATGRGGHSVTVLTFAPIALQCVVVATAFGRERTETYGLRIIDHEPLHALAGPGFDGTEMHRYRAVRENPPAELVTTVPAAAIEGKG
jgi:cellulose synthase (UDP-forming)